MKQCIYVARRGTHGDGVEQVEFGRAGGTHLVPSGFCERPEHVSKNTGFPVTNTRTMAPYLLRFRQFSA
jgi:hypothetical protein